MEENKEIVSYLDFVEEIKDKSIEEINVLLQQKNVFIQDIGSTEEFLIAGEVIRRINLCNKTDAIQFSYLKRSIIYFSILENYTKFDISSIDMGMENFILKLEIALKQNLLINHFYLVINDILKEQKMNIISELVVLFDNLPSSEELDVMQQKLKNMFDEESDEKLKLIDGILAYNDPTMQTIKEALLDETYMSEKNQEQLKNVADKTLSLLDKEKNKSGDDNGDNSK